MDSLAPPAALTSAASSSSRARITGLCGSLMPMYSEKSVGPMDTRSMPGSCAICPISLIPFSSSVITDSTMFSLDVRVCSSQLMVPNRAARVPPAPPRWPIGAYRTASTARLAPSSPSMCGMMMPCAPASSNRRIRFSSLPGMRIMDVTPTRSAAMIICVTRPRSKVVCSMSMNAASNPASPMISTTCGSANVTYVPSASRFSRSAFLTLFSCMGTNSFSQMANIIADTGSRSIAFTRYAATP